MKHATNVATSAGTEPCFSFFFFSPRTRASVLYQDDTLLFPDHPAFSSPPGNRYIGWVLGRHHVPLIYGTDQAKAKKLRISIYLGTGASCLLEALRERSLSRSLI